MRFWTTDLRGIGLAGLATGGVWTVSERVALVVSKPECQTPTATGLVVALMVFVLAVLLCVGRVGQERRFARPGDAHSTAAPPERDASITGRRDDQHDTAPADTRSAA